MCFILAGRRLFDVVAIQCVMGLCAGICVGICGWLSGGCVVGKTGCNVWVGKKSLLSKKHDGFWSKTGVLFRWKTPKWNGMEGGRMKWNGGFDTRNVLFV